MTMSAGQGRAEPIDTMNQLVRVAQIGDAESVEEPSADRRVPFARSVKSDFFAVLRRRHEKRPGWTPASRAGVDLVLELEAGHPF